MIEPRLKGVLLSRDGLEVYFWRDRDGRDPSSIPEHERIGKGGNNGGRDEATKIWGDCPGGSRNIPILHQKHLSMDYRVDSVVRATESDLQVATTWVGGC